MCIRRQYKSFWRARFLIKKLGEMMLFNLIYHWDWLLKNLHSSHFLLQSTCPFRSFVESQSFFLIKSHLTVAATAQHLPRGIPNCIHLLTRTENIENRTNMVDNAVHGIFQEQQKLSELIPFSAAGRGMMIGEKQLQKLKGIIAEGFRNINSQAMPAGDSEQVISDVQKTFTWGGKIRAIPVDFTLIRQKTNPSHLWQLWWHYSIDSSRQQIKPYRLLILKYKADIYAAYESRKEKKKAVIKYCCELSAVILWIEEFALKNSCSSLPWLIENFENQNESQNIQRKSAHIWKKIWPLIVETLSSLHLTVIRLLLISHRLKWQNYSVFWKGEKSTD